MDVKKYQAIIFDCGGVIFNFSPDNVFNHWATVSGENIDVIKQRFVFDEMYSKFERGEINASLFRRHTLNMLELKISDEDFDNGWNSIYVDPVPGIEQLLQELKTHCRLVALTNTNEIHANKWPGLYASLLCYFERVFSSHEIQARKPEHKAYKTVLQYLKLNPADVIFLDDNIEYVQAASHMNITSIHVTSFGQMVKDLRNLGVRVEDTVHRIKEYEMFT